MGKLNKFFSKKKIFITGHTGFKGSWLTETLINFGSFVKGYSLKDEKKSFYESFVNFRKVKNSYGDISDYKKLKNEIESFKPSIIFHLAAQPLVIDSYKDPHTTFKSKCGGLINLLNIVHNSNFVKSLVIITSDKCYKIKKEQIKSFKENDELGGYDPYSASKAAAEIITFPYVHILGSRGVGVATARAGNVIGGGDFSKNRIIPDCYRALNKKFLILRNPLSVRPWQHILDVVNGYLILSMNLYKRRKKFSGAWNFGPLQKNKSVKNLVDNFNKNLKKRIKIKVSRNRKNKLKETSSLNLDSKKSNKYLKWQTRIDFMKGVNLTAEWYENYLYNKAGKKITSSQIKHFFKL